MRVAVKCKNDKELVYALTNKEGCFEAVIPTNFSSSSSPNCVVMLLGGPVQVWAFKKSMMSKIVKAATGQKDSYSLSTRLTFFTSYPSKAHQSPDGSEKAPQSGVLVAPDGSSSTGGVGLPRPASTLPLIFYFPFLPIIGIP